MRPFRLSVALQLLLVFASGAVVGGMGYRLVVTHERPETPRKAPPPYAKGKGFRQRDQWYVDRMRSRLKLREDQVKKLTAIMNVTRQRFFEEKKRAEAKLQKEHAAEVIAILDPSQAAEYEKMQQEREKRMQQERDKNREKGDRH